MTKICIEKWYIDLRRRLEVEGRSMAYRDFSAQVKQDLLNLMKEIEEEGGEYYWDFSEVFDPNLNDPYLEESLKNLEMDIESYHKEILSVKKTKIEDLNRIWDNVYTEDSVHSRNFAFNNDMMTTLSEAIKSLADSINPNIPGQEGVSGLLKFPASYKKLLVEIQSLEYYYDIKMQTEIQTLLQNDPRFSQKT